MKKITFLLALMGTVWGYSQVRNYTFSQQTGVSYDEISDGTTLGGATTLDSEYFVDTAKPAGGSTVKGPGLPIGFNFVFNGTVYDKFGVNNDGWIGLGSSAISQTTAVDMTVNNPIKPVENNTTITPDALSARIAGLAADLIGQTGSSLSYKLVTASPNNYLVVQWKNYKKKSSTSGDSFNFQIRLYQNTNEVKIVYGNTSSDANTTLFTFQVGLRAEPSNNATNFLTRTSTSNWLASTAGTKSEKMPMSTTNTPPEGLAFTWTPPTCGLARDLVITNLSATTATLTWGNYGPYPNGPDSYEYIVGSTNTLPLASTSGTPVSTNTVTLTAPFLTPNTTYFFFVRNKCGNQTLEWQLLNYFKTRCVEQSLLYETFDSYANNAVPDCWDQFLTTTMKVNTGSTLPATAPNRLTLTVNGGLTTYSYALLPPFSNLADNTHQLRFKAITSASATRTLDVGYFSDTAQTTFVSVLPNSTPVNLPASGATPAEIFKEFTVVPGALANVKNLVIRIGGNASTYTVFLDDVIWEPKTSCPNVSALTAKFFTNNSAVISWTKGPAETQWQYAYSSTATNPYTLTGTDVPGTEPTLNLSGLAAATKYNVWIRSACSSTDFGGWVGPVTVTTTCAPANTTAENFESTAVNTLPSCWANLTPASDVKVINSTSPVSAAPSPANVLQIAPNSSPAIVMIKPLGNVQNGLNQMKLKVAAVSSATPPTIPAGASLEIGYLKDVTDATSFQPLQAITPSTVNTFEQIGPLSFGIQPKSDYLAFRATGLKFFIDDLVWEPQPVGCSTEITGIKPVQVNENTAKLKWKGGNETQWQYAIGSMSDQDPNALNAASFAKVTIPVAGGDITGTIDKLTPSTSYKVWIRALCDPTHPGIYTGPYVITTSCAGVTDIDENFDSGTTLPSCWYQVGKTGTVLVSSDTKTTTQPNNLKLTSSSTSGSAIIALPALSNIATNTHRLTFRYKQFSANPISIQVGYLRNIGDSSADSFISLTDQTPLISDTTNKYAVIDLTSNPAETNILAIRFNNPSSSSVIVAIDDVKWKPIPQCQDVKDLKLYNATHQSISFTWAAGKDETKWEYVVGNSSSAPEDLIATPVNNIFQAEATKMSNTAGTPLAPNTTYNVWVRAICYDANADQYVPGNYVGPLQITTDCSPITTFSENFNNSASALPACWKRVGSTGTVYSTFNSNESQDNYKLHMAVTATEPVVSMPAVDPASFADHILRFKMIGSAVGSSVQLGYITTDYGVSTFTPVATFHTTLATMSDVITYKFPSSPLSNILAFSVPIDQSGILNAVNIDNVEWIPAPTSAPLCADATAVIDANCGNYATTISWPSVAGADSYLFSLGTATGVYDLAEGKNLSYATSVSIKGDYNKTYYYKVVPVNFAGNALDCIEKSFTTNSNGCYCTSAPTSKDGKGVTSVVLQSTVFTPSWPTYSSFTDKPINVSKTKAVNLNYTLDGQASAYIVSAWLDTNNDFAFADDEKLTLGMSDALIPFFNIPAEAANGPHRLRIIARSGNTNDDPCYSGIKASTLDFTLNVVTPIDNDEPNNATPLTVGTSFATNAVEATNTNATASYDETAPDCGNYSGDDVWFKATVPASGKLTFEVNSVDGGLTNTAAALYNNQFGSLQLINCDDSSSTAGNDNPMIAVNDRQAGETLYFRVWNNGGNAFGKFKVSAYDESYLGMDAFSTMNLSVYPNPVKDFINISLDKDIDNVTISNMLGQIVLSKSINAKQARIDMSDLSKGTYLIKITAEGQSTTIKAIKK